MRKPCKLVLLKRRIAKPDVMTTQHREEYWAGRNAPGGEWVEIKSNAALLNKSDAKRDLLENPQFIENNQIYYCDVFHETEFELVDLAEKKSFDWVICQLEQNGTKRYYLRTIDLTALSGERYLFAEGHNLTLVVDEVQKNDIMADLAKIYPDIQFKAIELFTE